MDELEKVYRSWSQLNEYFDCGYRYYLKRLATDGNGEKVWRRPASWTVQGTAVHIAAEAWEKSFRKLTDEEVIKIYTEAYWDEMNKLLEETPNFDQWFASGPYRGWTDIKRRFEIGLTQIQAYLEFYCNDAPDETPVLINGEPAIEIAVEGLIGTVPVRGVVDAIMYTDRGWVVRDIKTGKRPGNPLQLKIYQNLIEQFFDFHVSFGDFWSGQTGLTSGIVDLDKQNGMETLTSQFERLEEGIISERFEPNPSVKQCGMCEVQHACPFAMANNRV